MSLCPVCYEKIPAVIYIDNHVWMHKVCDKHGEFYGIVERDPQWYLACKQMGSKNIYDGYLIDVTSKCNIKCKYCYHDNNGSERSIDEIIKDAEEHKDLVPFILTGGEPTTHKDLPEIIRRLSKIGEVHLLTNGINLCDEKYLDELLGSGLIPDSGIAEISLSFHKESNGKDIEFLELCRKKNLKIWTFLYVIDDLAELPKVIELFEKYKGTVNNFRIKAASNLWNESNADNRIFTSDIIKILFASGKAEFQSRDQKVSYAQIWYDDLDIKICSWYDVQNIDLWDIDCAPYYQANDRTINNFVTSAIINEGIDKKNGINIRRAIPNDIPTCGELWREMIIEEKSSDNPNVEMWCSKMYEFIKYDNNHIYVAEVKEKIVGFVVGFWDFDPIKSERFIVGVHFYVKPALRKTDIGIKLHNKYKEVGKKLGVKRVVRQVTQEHSTALLNKGQNITAVIMEEKIL